MDAASSGSRTWCGPPHRSNQPCQNSMHINGPVGCPSRKRARFSATREPKLPVRSTPGRPPAASISSEGWSLVNNGTSTPPARRNSATRSRYSWSRP